MIRHHRYSSLGAVARRNRSPFFLTLSAFALSCLVLVAVSSTASAAFVQNYGSHNSPDLMYMDVTESNGGATALFEAPSYSGNSIMFSPANFLAQAIPGGAPVIVDSTIDTILMADPNQVLNNIEIEEAGDHTLLGAPAGFASASVGAAFFVTVLEINGSDATGLGLPVLSQNLQVTTGAGPNGGSFSRPGDDGTATIWDGSVFIDLDAFLAANDVDGSVTKARLKWDNTLTAFADAQSGAFIKKKVVNGVVITTNVPEPTTCFLAAAGLLACASMRRRS